MTKTRVLISVKTYPTLSEKYDELVCTAGFLENGDWIRIYPIPFRKLKYDSQYKKWEWIEIDLTKNKKDSRKESFRPTDMNNDIQKISFLDTSKGWSARKSIVLNNNVRYNLAELVNEAKNPEIGTSLAVFKPKKIKDFVWEKCSRNWDEKKLAKVYAHQTQLNLFDDMNETKRIFKIAQKIPYKFSYVFLSDDNTEHKLMIEDWELGKLYRNCLEKANGNEQIACQKVKERYFDYMYKERDLYFFLGTTLEFHNFGTFIIIGTFYPPKPDPQLKFDF
jgi:hypothetical protein